MFTRIAEAGETGVHWFEGLVDVQVGGKGLPGCGGTRQLLEIGDDEDAHVFEAAEGVADLFELGDDGLRTGL